MLQSVRRGEHMLWLPVWLHDKVHACIEVTQSRPFSAHKLDVIQSVFFVYQNYQSLLDYSERDALTGLFNRKTFDEQFARRAGMSSNAATEVSTEPDVHPSRAASRCSTGWRWWTSTTSSRSTTDSGTCMATRC